jgi:hypothetical protein
MSSKPNSQRADSANQTPAPSPLRDKLLPGLRLRHDGWTEARLSLFLATLGTTGCIRDAARVAGVSVKGANDIRVRFPLFAAAWEEALARAQKGLLAVAHDHAVRGKETVIIRDGKEVERRITPDSATLGLLIKRGDQGGVKDPETGRFLSAEEAAARGLDKGGLGKSSGPDPATYITREEWGSNIRFNGEGAKQDFSRILGATSRLFNKLQDMAVKMDNWALEKGTCYMCEQSLPIGELPLSKAEMWSLGLLLLNPETEDFHPANMVQDGVDREAHCL